MDSASRSLPRSTFTKTWHWLTESFTHAWLYNTQMLCADVFQRLPLCAAKTKKIKLGTNVTNALSRIAPVTANNFHDFEPARPGKGDHGHRHWQYSATNTGNAGGTTSELRQHIDNCRGLLAGQTVPYEENSRRRAIRFLNPTGGWINLKQKVIPSQNLNSDILVMLPIQH
jgi:5,10-methylenetetrahydromethanopterin reductase